MLATGGSRRSDGGGNMNANEDGIGNEGGRGGEQRKGGG
jgi:hypothetical protein